MPKVILVMGYPASGKSTISQEYVTKGFIHLNRDNAGGKVIDLVPDMTKALTAGKDVVLDNLYTTVADRQPFIKAAIKVGATVTCVWLTTSIEDAQFNACWRMIMRQGKLLDPGEIKNIKDPNIFPPAVLFMYRKRFEKPTKSEGFTDIQTIKFQRVMPTDFKNKAIFLDYDDTLRKTISGNKWPTNPDDIEILPNRIKILQQYLKDGYLLFGISNQSGIAKYNPPRDKAIACFEHTNRLLGIDIPYAFCPHNPAPIACFCRKPMPGLGVQFILQNKLDPSQCIMVGDQTSDKTFALRCGFQYSDESQFFK